MKKILKYIYYCFIDKFAYTLKTPLINRFFYTLRYKLANKGMFLNSNEKKIKNLQNKHKGKRCFIIGNGPSLNSLDLTKLKKEVTFGVNAIYLNYDKMQFHPTYYVVEDNLVAEDRKEEINNYTGPELKIFGTFLRYCLKSDPKTVFINLLRNYNEKKYKPFFSDNALRSVGVGGSVTYVCLQMAYYMGFEKVYMIGFDHNYVIPKSVLIEDQSSSLELTSTEDDVNHFSKDYFGKGYRWHDPNVERMEVGFKEAEKKFREGGRAVYNATLGGHLNVFERVDFNSIFNEG
ncbi:6-hydroxymethylpterin diphosphokinase MptE-like protein [Tenacibaculum insulae]|uniref:6-hydroxymethylpterin diphosphokinase MptE-like protein n=1 Tax=Tenacibaculum insulae TaxID=2029677 RepID=UPI003AB555EA